MSEPWPQTHGFSVNTLSNPYIRMMNTSGIPFKDHAGSMVITSHIPNQPPYLIPFTFPSPTPYFRSDLFHTRTTDPAQRRTSATPP